MLASLVFTHSQIDEKTGKSFVMDDKGIVASFETMAQNLWNLGNYPLTLNAGDPEKWSWRDVKSILLAEEKESNVLLTAKKVMERNQDLGPYPERMSDVNAENKWMSLIRCTNSEPFNLIVSASLDGHKRVKAVDYISTGEQLCFKYEREQKPANANWNCIAHRLQGLFLQTCSGYDCTCYEHELKNNDDNYFFRKDDANPESSPPSESPTTNSSAAQFEINFNRAENYKNQIFHRISSNPFTNNLHHTLWDTFGNGHFAPASELRTEPSVPTSSLFQRCNLPLKRRHQSDLSDYPPSMDNKYKLHCELGLASSCEDEESRKSVYSNVAVEYDDRTCKICGNVCLNERGLKTHIHRAHKPKAAVSGRKTRQPKGGVKCNVCDKVCKTPKGVKIHHFYCHQKDEKINMKCDEDSVIFLLKKNVDLSGESLPKVKKMEIKEERKEGLKIVIEKLQLFSCTACDKMFIQKEHFEEHEKKCVAEREKKNVAEKRKQETVKVKAEMRLSVTEGRYTCDDCGEKFAYRQSLRIHSKEHESQRRMAMLLQESESETETSEESKATNGVIETTKVENVCTSEDNTENVESQSDIVETATDENIIEETISSMLDSLPLSCTDHQRSTSTPSIVEENFIPVVLASEENDASTAAESRNNAPCLNLHRPWKDKVDKYSVLRSLLENKISLPDQIQENTISTPIVLDDTAAISQGNHEISTPWALQEIPISKLKKILQIKNSSPVRIQENTISSAGRHQENPVKSSGSNQVNFEILDQILSSPYEITESSISTLLEIIDNTNFSSIDMTENTISSTNINNENEISSSSTSNVHQPPFVIDVDNQRSPLNPNESTLDLPGVDDSIPPMIDDEDTLSAISDDQGLITYTPPGTCYVCKICERRFQFELSLKFHMDMHMNSLLTNDFHFCPCCQTSFQTEDQLRKHLKVHLHEDS